MRQRPPRISVPGANLRFANTSAELLNVSQTGALVRLTFKPRLGGEWPLALDLPSRGQVWLNGRVVRCQPDPSRPGVAPSPTEYLLGLAFVEPSDAAQALLDQLCGTSTPRRVGADSILRRLPGAAGRRLRRFTLSLHRHCPECGSTAVRKEADRRYLCEQCGYEFAGFHLGRIRVSL